MKLQDVNLVMALIDANPSIKKHKFFRSHGKPCNFSPSAGVLLESHMTGAIAVIQDEPIFVGDRLWYKSSNYEGFVNVTGYNDSQPDDFNYYFCMDGTSLRDIFISESLLERFLSLKKPKPVYETVLFNGVSIRKPVLMRDELHTVKIEDGTGKEYWVDSDETAKNLLHFLQSVADTIIHQASEGNSISVIASSNRTGSNRIAKVRKINT